MSDRPKFLYCLPWSETMVYELDDLWDSFIDPPDTITVEEWTVSEPRSLLPTADRIIEEIVESAYHEGLADAYMEAAPSGGEVERLIDQALWLLASKVKFFMADEKVREFEVRRENE